MSPRVHLWLFRALLQLGYAALALGRADEAEDHAREALSFLEAIQGQVWMADALAGWLTCTIPRRPRARLLRPALGSDVFHHS